MRKTFSLALILILAASSLIMIKPTFAQTIPKPSIPEFTLKFTDASHYETYTDPYTGAQTTYLVQNKTIEISIKNQPFTRYTDSSGNLISLYYNIRSKGHFSQYWMERDGGSDNYLKQNFGSEYTMVPYYGDIPSSGQIDFQIEVIAGHDYEVFNIIEGWIINGTESGWSNIQTISIPDGSVSITPFSNPTPTQTPISTSSPTPTPSQTPTATPAIPEFSWLAILPLFVSVLFISLMLRHRKTNNLNQ